MAASKRRRCSAGVGQFAEAVGELDAADVELEPLGAARIVRAGAGQRRLGGRIAVEDRRPAEPEMRLDRSTRMRLKMSDQLSSSREPHARALRPARPERVAIGRPVVSVARRSMPA